MRCHLHSPLATTIPTGHSYNHVRDLRRFAHNLTHGGQVLSGSFFLDLPFHASACSGCQPSRSSHDPTCLFGVGIDELELRAVLAARAVGLVGHHLIELVPIPNLTEKFHYSLKAETSTARCRLPARGRGRGRPRRGVHGRRSRTHDEHPHAKTAIVPPSFLRPVDYGQKLWRVR